MKKIVIAWILLVSLAAGLMAQVTKENDWWVNINLTNGSVIEGAVLADRFVERAVEGMIYEKVTSENFRSVPGAGIRIYYVRGEPGFVFIPYRQISTVVIDHRLTAEEKAELERKIRHTELARAEEITMEEKKKREEQLKKEGVALTEEEERVRLEEEKRKAEEMAGQIQIPREEVLQRMLPEDRALLETFPPGDTWNEENYNKWESRWNRAVNSVQYKTITNPDGTKRKIVVREGAGRTGGLSNDKLKFVKQFSAWQRAVQEFNRQEALIKEEMAKKTLAEQEKLKEEKPEAAPEVATVPPTSSEKKSEGSQKTKKTKEDKTKGMKIEEAVDVLLYSTSNEEKIKALQALKYQGPKAKSASQAISHLALSDSNLAVKEAAVQALGEIQKPHNVVLQTLMDLLELSGEVSLRMEAAAALLRFEDIESIKKYQSEHNSLLLALNSEDDSLVKYRILRLFEKMGDEKYFQNLRIFVDDLDRGVQVAACSALIAMGAKKEKPHSNKWIYNPLVKGLSHEDFSVSLVAANALKRLNDPDTYPRIEKALENPKLDNEIRRILESIIQEWQAQKKAAESPQPAEPSQPAKPPQPTASSQPTEPEGDIEDIGDLDFDEFD